MDHPEPWPDDRRDLVAQVQQLRPVLDIHVIVDQTIHVGTTACLEVSLVCRRRSAGQQDLVDGTVRSRNPQHLSSVVAVVEAFLGSPVGGREPWMTLERVEETAHHVGVAEIGTCVEADGNQGCRRLRAVRSRLADVRWCYLTARRPRHPGG